AERRRTAVVPSGRAPAVDRTRIAVLPFANMTSEPGNEHFTDGLTEELINRLARVPGLQVVARTSAFRFKGRHADLREVGAQLNVGAIVEGSVRSADNQVRIAAQLVDAARGYQICSRTYQREYKDLFALQDELAQAVVHEIAPGEIAEARVVARSTAINLDAYNAYLRGLFALSNRFGDFGTPVGLFREALRMDPGYAPAWSGLAYLYWLMAWFYAMPSANAMPLSKETALRTLQLDSESAQAHSSLGLVESGFEWRWASAERRFHRAIELQ